MKKQIGAFLSVYFLLTVLVIFQGCGSSSSGGAGSGSSRKRIFLTSSGYVGGTLGGLSGADTICNTHATAANLGGTWKAWLSDSSNNAIDRISDVGPWYDVTQNILLFNNKTNLTTTPANGIGWTEFGIFVPSSGAIWTGTNAGGLKNANTCGNWSSTAARGEEGDTYDTGNAWTQWSLSPDCTSVYPFKLICIEQ